MVSNARFKSDSASGPERTKYLKIGLIGCGRVAQRVHLPLLAGHRRARLVAAAEPNVEARHCIARLAPEAELLADYQELLTLSEVEAVVICLPTHLHATAAIDALNAGKHVYLEKPVATNREDASALRDAWLASGKHATVGFNYRFHPLIEALRRRIAAGEIGRVVAVQSMFTSASRSLPHWKRVRATGGGALLDLLSHHADLIPYVLDQSVSHVAADVRSTNSEADTAIASMKLSDGTPVQTLVSMSATEQDRIEILGEQGQFVMDRHAHRLDWFPPRRHMSAPERIAKTIRDLRQSLASLRAPGEPSFRRSLDEFVDCTLSGQTPQLTLDDGLRSLDVVLAAECSATSGGRMLALGTGTADPRDDQKPESANNVARGSLEGTAVDLSSVAALLDDPLQPAISVVLVSIKRFSSLRKVVHHLRGQSIVDRLELILVAPTVAALDDMVDADVDGFFAVRKVAAGPIENVDKSAAHGIRMASAPVVALVEDHAYPQSGWAEAIVEAHRSGDWAAVGTAIENANPRRVLSWANMLLSYGQWVAANLAGPTDNVSRHNVTFKTRALVETYGDSLENYLGRDGGLLGDMQERGYRFYLEPSASVRHVNPSRWSSTIELRVGSGRLYGSTRARTEAWSTGKRWFYAVASPLIPVVRFIRLRRELLGPDSHERRRAVGGKAVPALIVGVILDGIGQAFGYALGPGNSPQSMALFEMDRVKHLCRSDLIVMQDD